MFDEPESLVMRARRRKVDQSARVQCGSLAMRRREARAWGIPAELAVLTGFSPEAIRSRIDDCSTHYPAELAPSGQHDKP